MRGRAGATFYSLAQFMSQEMTMSNNKSRSKQVSEMPEGAVRLKQGATGQLEFVARTGTERCQLIDGVWFVFPANKLAKSKPIEGPFVGVDRDDKREFTYMTYNAPDQNGVFVPVKWDLHPEKLAERIDERAAKVSKLTPTQREALGL